MTDDDLIKLLREKLHNRKIAEEGLIEWLEIVIDEKTLNPNLLVSQVKYMLYAYEDDHFAETVLNPKPTVAV